MQSPLPARIRVTLLFAVTASIGGCGGASSGYPSLAPRPIERLSFSEPNRPAPPPAVADPATVARLAPLIDRARVADADFRKVLAEERGALARGRSAAPGSEAWTAAQLSLSRVETARGPVAKALSDLDAGRSDAQPQANTGAAIASQQAFDQLEKLDQNESAALAAAWPSAD